jgi:hypothetical protein
MDTPPLSLCLLRVSKGHALLHGIRAGSLDDDGSFPPNVEHVFSQKLLHVKKHVKVSYIANRYMTWTLYKSWTPLLSQGLWTFTAIIVENALSGDLI